MSDYRSNTTALRVLLTLFSAGLRGGARSELEELLLAIRALQPQGNVADICEVRLLIGAGQWVEALHVLRQMDASGNGSSLCSALQAWCLYTLGDKEWQRHVAAVMDGGGDAASTALVQRFLQLKQPA